MPWSIKGKVLAEHGRSITQTCPPKTLQLELKMSLTFEEIVEKVRNFKVKPSQEDYLEFYGYYKQATAGDCDTDEPEEPLKKALWKSWKERKGMTADDAKAYYVKCYQKFSPKYQEEA